MRRVLAAIKSEGLAPRDIQTEQIGFDQNYSHGQLIGYTASNSVSVSLHDVAKTGELITRVVGAGSTLESGPTFSLENTDLAYRQALDKALDKAHANAAAMARHTGLTLGKPASIKEGVQNIVPVYARFDLEAREGRPHARPARAHRRVGLGHGRLLRELARSHQNPPSFPGNAATRAGRGVPPRACADSSPSTPPGARPGDNSVSSYPQSCRLERLARGQAPSRMCAEK